MASNVIAESLKLALFYRPDRPWPRRTAEKATSFERVYSLFPILKDRRHQLAGNLSGGEQQMCALARGLMAAPRLLAVDEMSLVLLNSAPVLIVEDEPYIALELQTSVEEVGGKVLGTDWKRS